MTRRSALRAGTLAAAGALAYAAQARRDRAAIEADPASRELHRSLSPDSVCLDTRSGGRELVVDTYGPEDAPVVVLVHGWTCTARFWTRQIQALRHDHRVVAYDLRGHGRSAQPADGDYSIEALADDLERVVDAFAPAERSFVLAGHSLGAMTIVAWAERHAASAARLGAAALVNTGIAELVAESKVAPLPARLAAVQTALGPRFLTANGPTPVAPGPLTSRLIRHIALSTRASAAEVGFCARMVLECPAPARAGCGHTIAGLDLWSSLPALEAPTVVIVSERDRLTPPSHGRRIAAELPAAIGVVELPRAGHMGPIESPALVTQAIRGLARGYAATSVAATVSLQTM